VKNRKTWWDHQDVDYLSQEFLRDRFDGVNHPSRRYLRRWLKARPGLSLLDIPCGPGVEYEGFKANDVRVQYTGMDQSATMVRIFRSKFPEADVRQGDILNIPLPDASVDVVLCRHILEHLGDYRRAVVEAVRVARKHVFIVLFKVPTGREERAIGWGACENRLDWRELEDVFRALDVTYRRRQLPYDEPVDTRPPYLEENTVIELNVGAARGRGIGGPAR
jgi:SAM-dependent methyltransferase